MIEEFRQLGLSEESLQALQEKGFEEPTEIQRQCIPLLLNGEQDVIGQAQTGTGKTAAFALPIIEKINHNAREVQALVLTPTRELCVQECDEINSLAGRRTIEVAPIYGGASMEAQLRQLKKGVDIVVGTPGRILDHLQRGTLDISHIRFFILDEADEMLDMGFIEDIETILEQAPQEKRMLCFSATMPEPILKLASRFMPSYTLVRTQTEDLTSTLTEQLYYETRESEKLEVLMRVIEITDDFYGLVFCRTKVQCDHVGAQLIDRGYNAEVLHGDLSQKQREIIIRKMRAHMISILVATDVAARGIDLPDLTHVINYALPQDPETYIHRVGRTGRAGRKGLAITFVNTSEFRKFSFIQRIAKSEISKAQVPSIDQIRQAKEKKIHSAILSNINENVPDSRFAEMAAQLCEGKDAIQVLAALLKQNFERDLDTSRFKPITDLYSKGGEKRRKGGKSNAQTSRGRESEQDESAQYAGLDDQGFTRLFIAKGERDGINKRDLVSFLMDKTGASSSEIRQVEVHDDFSFVTAPFNIADKILAHLGGSPNGKGRSIVSKARTDRPAPSKRSKRERRSRASSGDSFRDRRISREEIEFLRYSEKAELERRRSRKIKKSGSKKKKRR